MLSQGVEKDASGSSIIGSSAFSDKIFVTVHAGAGNHSKANANRYKQICKQACEQAIELLRSKKSALEAVTAAVMALENDELTNAGYGSSLTFQGNVECEACVMNGASLHFGSVAALSGVKNPVKAASLLVKEQMEGLLPFGRIRPSVLVGKGAKEFCACREIDASFDLISKSSLKTYNRYKKKCGLSDSSHDQTKKRKVEVELTPVENDSAEINFKPSVGIEYIMEDEMLQDTVGAICVDYAGNVAAASSSGGIWLKHPGRLGPVSAYGAGCWAQNNKSQDRPGTAVVTSGCGEHIMQTILAKTCADGIRSSDDLQQSLSQVFTTDFLESEFLSSTSRKMAGVIALKLNEMSGEREVEMSWIHSTASFCFAFMGGADKTPTAILSQLDRNCLPGQSFAMGGHIIRFNNTV